MTRYSRSRSKQAMQKLVEFDQTSWGAADTFKVIDLTGTGGFDEECIVKRIRVSISIQSSSYPADIDTSLIWSILQTQTDSPPTESDMTENNMVIATGIVTVQNGSITYDHTITMRKLTNSGLWLGLQCPFSFAGTPRVTTVSQVHFVED